MHTLKVVSVIQTGGPSLSMQKICECIVIGTLSLPPALLPPLYHLARHAEHADLSNPVYYDSATLIEPLHIESEEPQTSDRAWPSAGAEVSSSTTIQISPDYREARRYA